MKDKYELMKDATFGEFRCQGCNALLEPDAEYCGLCGWKNPLISEGLI